MGSLSTMPSPALVDEGVRGAEVDGEVAGHDQRLSSPAGARPGPRRAAWRAAAWVRGRRPGAPARPSHGGRRPARLEGVRLPVLQPQHQPRRRRDTTTTISRNTRAFTTRFRRPRRCAAPRDPSSRRPPSASRFQIGTVRLSSSMANRAASKASARWGADTATTTAASPSPRRPCGAAARPGRPPATGSAPRRAARRSRATRGLLVGLVLEPVHRRASGRVVAGGAGEGDRGPAVGAHHPGRCRGHRQRRRARARPSRHPARARRRRRDPSRPPYVARGPPGRGRHYRLDPCPWTTMPTTTAPASVHRSRPTIGSGAIPPS